MSMTEKEAQKKWCPETRLVLVPDLDKITTLAGISPSNRIFNNRDGKTILPDPTRCIASSCMMWTWDASSSERAQKFASARLNSELEDAAQASDTPTRGSCGLSRAS